MVYFKVTGNANFSVSCISPKKKNHLNYACQWCWNKLMNCLRWMFVSYLIKIRFKAQAPTESLFKMWWANRPQKRKSVSFSSWVIKSRQETWGSWWLVLSEAPTCLLRPGWWSCAVLWAGWLSAGQTFWFCSSQHRCPWNDEPQGYCHWDQFSHLHGGTFNPQDTTMDPI